MAHHRFYVGDYANSGYGSDSYPYMVVAVSPSGKTVTVERVTWILKEEFRGKCFGQNITEDMVMGIKAVGDRRTFRLTTRRGRQAFRSHGSILNPGFCFYNDPHR